MASTHDNQRARVTTMYTRTRRYALRGAQKHGSNACELDHMTNVHTCAVCQQAASRQDTPQETADCHDSGKITERWLGPSRGCDQLKRFSASFASPLTATFAAAGMVANIGLSSIHTAGLIEWQNGLLRACVAQIVQAEVHDALHQSECCMLEEVGSELVASKLGGQLSRADEAATKDLHYGHNKFHPAYTATSATKISLQQQA